MRPSAYDRIEDGTGIVSRARDACAPRGRARLTYGAVALGALLLCLAIVRPSPDAHEAMSGTPARAMGKGASGPDEFDELGRFIMRDFDLVQPMSSFLPGIGGLWGMPMWAFFVNRGQGIASFGVRNKDGAIMKFETADVAYRTTHDAGFRSLLKGTRPSGAAFAHQPFFEQRQSASEGPDREMVIGMNEMEVHESHAEHGVDTSVLYFTVANEEFPALVRRATFTNTDPEEPLHLELLDGLAKLEPYGIPNGNLQAMGRTMEAWMNVYNVEDGDMSAPFFHVSQDPGDTAQVQVIQEGHFALSFLEGDFATVKDDGRHELLQMVVDPTVVFGSDTTMTVPRDFLDAEGVASIATDKQCTSARTPSALAAASVDLPPGASVTVTSVYGHAYTLEDTVANIIPRVSAAGFVSSKRAEGSKLTAMLSEKVKTKTSSRAFDAYVEMDFLDNVLRGGLPYILGDQGNGDEDEPKVYHTFSRIHGDLERDYNNFQLDLTYFSQGPGNFRDVNQNRRLDVTQEPRVRDFNVRTFLSFVQSDGYNPLTVATSLFSMPKADAHSFVEGLGAEAEPAKALKKILAAPFRPGDLFDSMKKASCTLEHLGVDASMTKQEFLNAVAKIATQVPAGAYNQNGFWADHWTYTQDLVDNYVAVYPDKEEWLLFDSEPVPFYTSPSTVKPRSEKYVLQDDGSVAQASAVADAQDTLEERHLEMLKIWGAPDFVQDEAGQGGAWQRTAAGPPMRVSVYGKLFMLSSLKFSTLDALGMGVEMEAGKPGWNDAMNGLPGIMGSATPETFETIRLSRYLMDAADRFSARSVQVPSEFADMLTAVGAALDAYNSAGEPPISAEDEAVPEADFAYWDAVSSARERYRAQLVGSFSGNTTTLSAAEVKATLKQMIGKMDRGVQRALQLGGGIAPTYFSYSVRRWSAATDADGADTGKVAPLSMGMPTLYPLFLEGPVRHLKVLDSLEEKRGVYEKVRASTLHDEKLEMYKICESLQGQPLALGRMMAFQAGWLENESIWMHMSYKLYLEMLRGGLYEDFYKELRHGTPPFMDHKQYGRSPLEASSFIASSAFPDERLHGSGFLARLSGSTAEFLSMWNIIMAGPQPFRHRDGALTLELKPVIADWLFTDEGTASFTFLGRTALTYHSAAGKSTWAMDGPTSIVCKTTDGKEHKVAGGVIPEDLARKTRELQMESIDVYF